jgi:hypothetical protein
MQAFPEGIETDADLAFGSRAGDREVEGCDFIDVNDERLMAGRRHRTAVAAGRGVTVR